MVRFSIIIPYFGDEEGLDGTLVSVLENRPAKCEIIVVLGVPYADPHRISGEVRFVEPPPMATAADCLNRGLAIARGPIVHLVACGVEASPGWTEPAIRRLADAAVASVAAVVSDRKSGKIISAGLGFRAEGVAWRIARAMELAELAKCRADLCGPDPRAAFYCRSALEEIGGFSNQANDALMGIEAAMRLRRLGFRCALEPGCCLNAAAEWPDERPSFRLGHDAERLFWRWASTRGWTRSLLGHAALIVGESALAMRHPCLWSQVAGRAYGAALSALARRRPRPTIAAFAAPDGAKRRPRRAA
ncbi:MAG: hypothetical protein JW959_00125 [Pirellulales bacterium]|nr:hypothetical protein [Pirellulales bacterium]